MAAAIPVGSGAGAACGSDCHGWHGARCVRGTRAGAIRATRPMCCMFCSRGALSRQALLCRQGWGERQKARKCGSRGCLAKAWSARTLAAGMEMVGEGPVVFGGLHAVWVAQAVLATIIQVRTCPCRGIEAPGEEWGLPAQPHPATGALRSLHSPAGCELGTPHQSTCMGMQLRGSLGEVERRAPRRPWATLLAQRRRAGVRRRCLLQAGLAWPQISNGKHGPARLSGHHGCIRLLHDCTGLGCAEPSFHGTHIF